MGSKHLKSKELRKLGLTNNQHISQALDILKKHFKHNTIEEQENLIKLLTESPESIENDSPLLIIAKSLSYSEIEEKPKTAPSTFKLNEIPAPYTIFGSEYIHDSALDQMGKVMRLPIVKQGALLPDAHLGYGLPIGSVITTKNEVIPYGIGLDIGCRMSLSIFDVPAKACKRYIYQMEQALRQHTHFGLKPNTLYSHDHAMLEREEFYTNQLLKTIHRKAAQQLGTSGSGNHFVEFGEVEIFENAELSIPQGTYVGLLSHSGSRGLGATIGDYYSKLAMRMCNLPKGMQHLSWLDLKTQEGNDYWEAMQLAGQYSEASHELIHKSIAKAMGFKILTTIENHHNFAWKEMVNGEEMIVHRKGATPAHCGQLGIIPGSMASKGYVVRGKGNTLSLNSSSHGAGRKIPRNQAKSTFTRSALNKYLSKNNIQLIGGAVEESPQVYKSIDEIMTYQTDIVETIASFQPRIVRMDKK